MPAILFGAGLIVLSYYFVKSYFNQLNLPLATAFLVTFSSWMIVQSRAGSEALVALVFSLLGFLMFKAWVEKGSWWRSIFTFGWYFLALYSYNATRLALPLIHAVFLYYLWPQVERRERPQQIIFASILLIFSFGSVFVNHSRMMSFNNTSLLTNPVSQEAHQVIYNREGSHHLSPTMIRIFSNQLTEVVLRFVQQYCQYFSFEFLFHDAGFHKRYLVPKVGPLLVWILPLILTGMIWGKLEKRQKQLLWLWIALAPLPAAITVVYVPNLKRAMYLFFPLLIFAGAGLVRIFSWLRGKKWLQRILAVVLLAVFSWNFAFFVKQYIIHTKYETTQHRSYGYKQLFQSTEDRKEDYQKIIIFENIDTPYTFYLLYTQYSPRRYQQLADEKKRDLFAQQQSAMDLGQYQFRPGSCPQPSGIEAEAAQNYLYVMPAGCLNNKDLGSLLKIISKIKSTDQSIIFYLAEANKN